MSRLLVVLTSIVVVLIGALLIGPSFFDWNKYKPEISKKIEQATGYQVDMSGDINLAIIPSPTAKIEGLSVSVPGQEPFLSLKRADVQLALAPLLQKKVEVDQVTLIEPNVDIRKNADGSMSYMTEKLSKAAEVKDALQGQSSSGGGQPDIAFNKISVESGNITYVDVAANQTHELKSLDVVLRAQSLKGPFASQGSATYNDQDVAFEARSESVLDDSGAIPVQMTVSIPQGDTAVQFSGVVDTKALEVQGSTKITSANLQQAGQAAKLSLPTSLKEAFSIEGTLVAGQDSIKYSPMMLTLGNFQADGDIAISNFKDKNPVRFDVVLESDDILALDGFAAKTKSSALSGSDGGAVSKASTSPVPESLQLPFDLRGDARVSLAGVQLDGKLYQGVDAQMKMADKAVQAAFKIQKAPGDTTLDASTNLSYASASKSKTGAITYADPSLSITAKGKISSISKLANAYDIQLSKEAKRIASAGFDINASLEKDRIVLKNSSLVLDDTTAAIAGFYKPNASGRDTVGIDLSADSVDFDKFIPQKATDTESAAPASAASAEESVAAVKSFSLPFDADFDISIQKAKFQGKAISGLRLEGAMDAKSLTLKQAGVQDYMNTAVTTKGKIADLPNLSGIDLDIYAKTANVRELMKNLNMDTASLPANIGSAEANVSTQGDLKAMTFASNVKALSGQLDAKGNVKNPLNKPQFSNMQVGIKHPNFVTAMQIISPEFTAGNGLQQKIDIFANIDQSGDVITLSGIKGNFGSMSMSGNMKAVMGGGKPSIDGTIALGTVPLDTFLGDEQAQAARTSKSAGSSSSSSSGRWSSRALDVNWMNSANVNLAVNAKGVNYGGWSFTEPKTTITMNADGLKIADLNAGLFGGSATVNTTLKPHSAGGLSAAVSSSMSNVGLESLVYAMSNSSKLKAQGNVSMSMNVNAAGTSANALVNALGGSATLEGRDVVMEGFDLAKLARSLSADIKPGDSVQALTSGLRGGTTQIDTIDGVYDIQSGVATITSMVMDGPAASITSTGNVSIPKYYIDTKHAIVLKDAANDVPSFEVAIKGPLDNPGNTFGKGILEDFLQRKIQRKLAKEAEKFLGDKVDGQLGGVINQILGGGSQTAPASPAQQAPAAGNDNAAPAQQEEQAPASTEEQLIRGVLDGLLR